MGPVFARGVWGSVCFVFDNATIPSSETRPVEKSLDNTARMRAYMGCSYQF